MKLIEKTLEKPEIGCITSSIKLVEKQMVHQPIKLVDKQKVGCIFTIQKFNAKGEITYQGKPFKNLVLNVGLDQLAVRSLLNATLYCNVGTGNTAPAITDTGLTTFFAGTDNIYGDPVATGTAVDPMYASYTRVFEFAIGTFSSQNIAELSLSNTSNTDHFNHQLVKDGGGSPTTIAVVADEGLRVTAELRIYSTLQTTDAPTDSFLINEGEASEFEYGWTQTVKSAVYTDTAYSPIGYDNYIMARQHFANILCAVSATDMSDVVTNITTQPDSVTYNTYTAGDFYREATCIWNAGTFIGDVDYIGVGYVGSGAYDRIVSLFTLDDSITITDVQELTLVIRREWDRV